MGMLHLLTIAFVICKLIGLIDWPWLHVLLPTLLVTTFFALLGLITVISALLAKHE